MRPVDSNDIHNIALGATLLGSGGGGDTEHEEMLCQELISTHGNIPLITLDELDGDDLVVPIAFMGAPLVGIEKLPSGKEAQALVNEIENYYGKKVRAFIPAEIGGSNAIVPFISAAACSLCVADADMIGRAFPNLQMNVGTLAGCSCSPAFIADNFANTIILQLSSVGLLERYARALTASMGSSSCIAFYVMSASMAKQVCITGSISLTLSIGKELSLKRGGSTGLTFQDSILIGSGVIIDIEQEMRGGFLNGKIKIQGDDALYTIDFQNEYLVVFEGSIPRAMTPDILALIEMETSLPLSVERVRYGLEVAIFSYTAPGIWKTAEGLDLVGPQAFGYSFRHQDHSNLCKPQNGSLTP
jgi:uncharacterized protein